MMRSNLTFPLTATQLEIERAVIMIDASESDPRVQAIDFLLGRGKVAA